MGPVKNGIEDVQEKPCSQNIAHQRHQEILPVTAKHDLINFLTPPDVRILCTP